MSTVRTGFTKRLWLFLYQQGGRWTPKELRAQDLGYGGKSFYSDVAAMAAKGLITKFDGPAYGVTKDCLVPRVTTLAELEPSMK